MLEDRQYWPTDCVAASRDKLGSNPHAGDLASSDRSIDVGAASMRRQSRPGAILKAGCLGFASQIASLASNMDEATPGVIER